MTVEDMNIATLYVLRQGCALEQHIAPGSGIVGKPDRHGLTLIYFEGNLLDTPAMRSHEGRVACAAKRLFENAATTALIYVGPQDAEASLLDIGKVRWDSATETCRMEIDPSRMDLLSEYLLRSPGQAC